MLFSSRQASHQRASCEARPSGGLASGCSGRAGGAFARGARGGWLLRRSWLDRRGTLAGGSRRGVPRRPLNHGHDGLDGHGLAFGRS